MQQTGIFVGLLVTVVEEAKGADEPKCHEGEYGLLLLEQATFSHSVRLLTQHRITGSGLCSWEYNLLAKRSLLAKGNFL